MSTAVTKMTAEERATYQAALEAKPVKTARDLRHLARLARLSGVEAPQGAGGSAPVGKPARPQATPRRPRKARRRGALPIDSQYRYVRALSGNMVVPWLLMAGYAYHIHDVSLLSDGLFDEMCADLLARWDEVSHRHKDVITVEDLRAGSLYRLAAGDYPVTARGACAHLLRGNGHMVDDFKGLENSSEG